MIGRGIRGALAVGHLDPRAPRFDVPSPGERALERLRNFIRENPNAARLPDALLADGQNIIDENLWRRAGDAVAAVIIETRNGGRLRHPRRSYTQRPLVALPLPLDWSEV